MKKKKSPPFLGDIESKCGEGTGGLSFYPGSKSEAQLFDSRCAVFIKLNSTQRVTLYPCPPCFFVKMTFLL